MKTNQTSYCAKIAPVEKSPQIKVSANLDGCKSFQATLKATFEENLDESAPQPSPPKQEPSEESLIALFSPFHPNHQWVSNPPTFSPSPTPTETPAMKNPSPEGMTFSDNPEEGSELSSQPRPESKQPTESSEAAIDETPSTARSSAVAEPQRQRLPNNPISNDQPSVSNDSKNPNNGQKPPTFSDKVSFENLGTTDASHPDEQKKPTMVANKESSFESITASKAFAETGSDSQRFSEGQDKPKYLFPQNDKEAVALSINPTSQDNQSASAGSNYGAVTQTMGSPEALDRIKTIERFQSLIQEKSTQLRSLGKNQVEIIFRPSAETSLKLTLVQDNQQICVKVAGLKGGGEWLNSHWEELQTSLEKSNIKLESLSLLSSSDFDRDGSHAFSNSGQFFNKPQEQLRSTALENVQTKDNSEQPEATTLVGDQGDIITAWA